MLALCGSKTVTVYGYVCVSQALKYGRTVFWCVLKAQV